MITKSPTGEEKRPDMPLPLTLEIAQGESGSLQFPVMVRSLSARGVILATYLAPEDLNLEGSEGRDSIIHLPSGEITEIRGSLLWARPREEEGAEVVFGLELDNSTLKVRRALEEQLLAYPADLKNLWDHWDAVHEEHEFFSSGQPVSQESPKAFPPEPTVVRPEPVAPQAPTTAPSSDKTIYWVGFGAVLAGLAVYYLAPEFYRLFGVILAGYGSLTIVGKALWSLFKNQTKLPM